MKKILSVFIITILILSSLSFVGCSGDSYSLELIVQGLDVDLDISGGLKLSAQNNSHTFSTDSYPFMCENIRVVARVLKNNTNIVYSKNIYSDLGSLDGVVQTYSIYDFDGKKIDNARLTKDSVYLTEAQIDNGYIALDNKPGVHVFEFVIPKLEEYGINETIFTVQKSFVEDTTRTKQFELKWISANVETVTTQEEGYNIYRCSSKPVFQLIDREIGTYVNHNNLIITYKRIVNGYWMNSSSPLHEKGIYFCSIYYDDNIEYKAYKSEFYILFGI